MFESLSGLLSRHAGLRKMRGQRDSLRAEGFVRRPTHRLGQCWLFSLILTFSWVLGLSTGCGDVSYRKLVSISGPSQSRIGDTVSFNAIVIGLPSGVVTWSVNGIVGGNPSVGTISSAGFYTASGATGSVTISCASTVVPSVQSSVALSILNPIPAVTSAAVIGANDKGFVVDIVGAGFVPQSSANFVGTPAPTTFISSNELKAQLALMTPGSVPILATVSNPDPGAATSRAIEITIPAVSVEGPTQIPMGQTTIYTATVAGLSNATVTWSVNGTVGGDAGIGTISTGGVYSPPAITGPVTISCASVIIPSIQSAVVVSIMNPTPVISSAVVISTDNSAFLIDVIGTGFLPQSAVSIAGHSAEATVLSSTELHASISQTSTHSSTVPITVSNPSPVSSDSNEYGLALPPSSLQQLTGCSNPNSGAPTGDWGTSSSPIYVDLSHIYPNLNPAYSSNSVFWVSRETSPGQSVLMTGAFTPSKKSVRLAPIPPGTIDWQSIVRASTVSVPSTQQGVTGLSFVVPSQFPVGVYGFEIDDPSAMPILGLANAPSMTWTIGVPSDRDPIKALQTQIHDCAAEPGEALRTFGKNFVSSSQLVLESSSGSILSIAPSKADANSITALIPATTAPGTYYAWVGSYPWDATSSPISLITILSPPPLQTMSATCTSLVGNGQTDNGPLLQSCLDVNASPANSDQIVYISVPDGVFLLSTGVTVRSHEVLVGASPSTTQFVGQPLIPPAKAWFTLSQYSGLANLSVKAPSAPSIVSSSDTSGNPATSGHFFLGNVDLDSTPSGSNNLGNMAALYGPDIQIYNSTFVSGTQGNLAIQFGDGAILSGNTMIDDNGFNALGSSQNIIVEDNSIYSNSGPGPTATTAFSIGRPFCLYCKSMVSQDLYIGYNSIQNLGAVGNQIITEDGGGGAYYGLVSSSTDGTVVLADDPSWDWVGTTNPSASIISIVSGTGIGQYSAIENYNGRTLNLVTPLKVDPDSTSWVVIANAQLNLNISHNSFTNTLGRTINIFASLDSVVEDNALINSGDGIRVESFGPYAGFGPTFNVDVLRNTISVGEGDRITASPNDNVAGVGFMQAYGGVLSGIMVRENEVAPIQSIYSTNGIKGVSAVLIEQNQGDWVGPNPSIPGYLAEDNSIP